MKFRIKTALFLLFSLSIALVSCKKDEGFGGNSHIKGKIVKKIYNKDYSVLLEELPAKDEDVFLLFGDKSVVSEKIETSYTGDFCFEYLLPGEYSIFYYSKDYSATSDQEVEMLQEISLKKGETLDLGSLVIFDTYDFDEGEATIEGKIWVKNYYNSTTWPNLVVKDITPAQEQDVYLIYENHKQYDQKIRSNYDGSFAFTNLIKGNYTIYCYSEDIKGGTADIVMKSEVEITEKNQTITLDEITIEKL